MHLSEKNEEEQAGGPGGLADCDGNELGWGRGEGRDGGIEGGEEEAQVPVLVKWARRENGGD